MSALSAYVGQLQRFVAPLGQFDTFFPDAGTADLTAALADGWAEARLKGFFSSAELDLDDYTVTPDIQPEQGALIVLFAGVRILKSQIANRKSHVRYEAPGVVSEQDYASSVLVQLLKGYEEEKKEIIAAASTYGAGDAFYMCDMAVARAIASFDLGQLVGGVDYHDPTGGLL